MVSVEVRKLLQKVFILAAGRGAAQREMSLLESQVETGGYTQLADVVNHYMTTLATTQGKVATLKQVAMNGLNLVLDDVTAAAIADQLDNGQTTWASLFSLCITLADANGQVLDNRAEAAQGFLSSLESTAKTAFYAGEAVNQAVRNLIQGIDASPSSLEASQDGLAALAGNLAAEGIHSYVIDGYVKGAMVFVDGNANNVLDGTEFSTTTSSDGSYYLPANVAGSKVIAFGGTDILSGTAFKGVLSAPAGAITVSSLTTLLQAQVEAGESLAQAVAKLQQVLDLPANVNLLNYDPLAILSDPAASTAEKATALHVQKTALQVANLMTAATVALAAQTAPATLLPTAGVVTAKLLDYLTSGETIDLAAAASMHKVILAAAAAMGMETTEAENLANSLGTVIANLNGKTAEAGTPDRLAKVALVSQSMAIDAIEQALAGAQSLESIIPQFSGSALDKSISLHLGQPVIDLGASGKLIEPIQVEGKWYYYWDLSGDGTCNDLGNLNGGSDGVTHDVLARSFSQDINGNLNPGSEITETYRYAILNGVKLALPTANGGMAYPKGINAFQPGTSVQNGATNNPVYDELLAIWDAHNGGGTDASWSNGTGAVDGTPSGWRLDNNYYLSATPSEWGHAVVVFNRGYVDNEPNNFDSYVALEVIDRVAPVFSSGISTHALENVAPGKTVYDATADDDIGVSYTLSGVDGRFFKINASTGDVSFKGSPDYEHPADQGRDNHYNFIVQARNAEGKTTDLGVSLKVDNLTENNRPVGQAVIDLGAYGKLIEPVQVEGKWYYYWDGSGDGTSASTGSLNFGDDMVSFDQLNRIFTQDINGHQNPASGITETYRYAILNGVKLALPTANGGMAYPNGISAFQPGTSVQNGATNNPVYDELLAIWDAHNGAGTDVSWTNGAGAVDGTPSGWQLAYSYYCSATPSGLGHTMVSLDDGFAYNSTGSISGSVALQVVDIIGPVFSSAVNPNILENVAPGKTVYDATADDDIGVSYTLSGVDGQLFNINSGTGEVSFKQSPDYEAAADQGRNNYYDFTVRASKADGKTTDLPVSLKVDDASENVCPTGLVIDLGSYGRLVAPVQVEGKWYYYWDGNGEGAWDNNGSLYGGPDFIDHDLLDRFFTQDINGNQNPGSHTTDTYRYAILNGLKLALPTANGGMPFPEGINNLQAGTAVMNSTTNNPVYDELLAIWDAHNTGDTGTTVYGAPPNWPLGLYWSATPSALGHADVSLYDGHVYDESDASNNLLALQVIDIVGPVFSSAITANVLEKTPPGTTVYDATADDDKGISYTLFGVDSLLFNINASTGEVSFRQRPEYALPADQGGDNFYDFTVRASNADGKMTDLAISLKVDDVLKNNSPAGQEVIDLGDYGKLIAPVQVEGKWYYHWDRSGDGSSVNTGSEFDDAVSHDILDSIFSRDIKGNLNPDSNTNDTYRYAMLNGVKVALPTVNGSMPYPRGSDAYQPGTGVQNGVTNNPMYDEMLAIWDAHNGADTNISWANGAQQVYGVPSGWQASTYWSATPSVSGHATLSFNNGNLGDTIDNYFLYALLQVL